MTDPLPELPDDPSTEETIHDQDEAHDAFVRFVLDGGTLVSGFNLITDTNEPYCLIEFLGKTVAGEPSSKMIGLALPRASDMFSKLAVNTGLAYLALPEEVRAKHEKETSGE